MAYRRYSRYKRRYARKGNRGYSYSNRRRFHRSRYRRYRRYRRRINRKIEYKRIEGTVMYNFSTSSQKVSDLNRYFQIINPYPYGVYCIGYKSSNHPLAFPGVYIDSGTSINQRIGLKISPVKLRILVLLISYIRIMFLVNLLLLNILDNKLLKGFIFG